MTELLKTHPCLDLDCLSLKLFIIIRSNPLKSIQVPPTLSILSRGHFNGGWGLVFGKGYMDSEVIEGSGCLVDPYTTFPEGTLSTSPPFNDTNLLVSYPDRHEREVLPLMGRQETEKVFVVSSSTYLLLNMNQPINQI